MNEQTNPWTILTDNQVYDNPWITVTEFKVLNPSGGQGIYGKVHFKNKAIGIVALDDELNTYLVGQYRFTLSLYSWEIPEVGGTNGEDSLETAKRELQEETGIEATEWTKLMDFHLSNSVSDEHGIIYLARGLHQKEAMPEETEQLVIRKMPFEDAFRMVEDGAITDSMSVAGIQKIKILMLQGRL